MNRDHSVSFETVPEYGILNSLVDHEGYPISSKGFLPTVVDIMVIWIKITHSGPFYSLIPKISMFTLAISCLTTPNLPWFMDLTFQVPIQYFLYSIRLYFHHQLYSQLGGMSRIMYKFCSSFFVYLFCFVSSWHTIIFRSWKALFILILSKYFHLFLIQ